ncbi:MAG: DUF4214 domain-containing protein [Lachnospiraceae bacterium]|nr:DUF4214 domain-containing protein [Lachnospiraceae bacterium]
MRKRIKKWIAMFLCLAMVFSILPAISVKAADPEIKLKFSADDLDKVDISYQIGEASPVSLDKSQADAEGAIWISNIANGSGVKITVNPKENIEINNVRALEGEAENAGPAYGATWDSTTKTYSFTATFNNGTSRIYVVSIETDDGGTQNPPAGNPPPTYANPKDITMNLSQINDEGREVMIVDNEEALQINGYKLQNGKITIDEDATEYKLEIQVAFGSALSKVTINNKEYSMTDLGMDKFSVTIPKSEIRFDTANDVVLLSGSSKIATIVWSDSVDKFGDDAYLENGKADVISITRNGQEIYNESTGSKDNSIKVDITDHDGYVSLEKGDDVVLKLVPNYGYQLKSVDLNGCTAIPVDSSVSTFEIHDIQTNLHFKGIFEEAEDKIDISASETVTGASLENGENAANSGNLQLTVADNDTYNVDVTDVVAGEAEKVASLDLTLDNIVSKGNNSYWTSNITSFDSDIQVGLNVDNTLLEEGETFSVVRDHNGTLTELDVTYDFESGILKFPTNQFSTYTIVKKSEKNIDNDYIQTVSREDAENFVSRMYTVALGRDYDDSGLKDWCDELVANKKDAAGIAYGFFFSKEYRERNRTNEEFVEDLYQTILGRPADETGKANWIKALENGKSRESVLAGFVNSGEFTDMCDTYSIPRGTMEEDGSSVCNVNVRKFVLRNYAKALDRRGETNGVETWCHLINSNKMTPAQVAESFIRSEEFKNKKLSDEEFVEILYETFLGRSSDPAGKSTWLNCLKKGQSRDEVMKGFSNSAEFSKIVASFGL